MAMESVRVQELREEFGIKDSRNTYTEEQLLKLSSQKIYYIKAVNKEYSEDILIKYREVFGYVSEDASACVFVKDSFITGDGNTYRPVVQISGCKKVADGVYHDKTSDCIYCVTGDLQACLDYAKEYFTQQIQERKADIEEEYKQKLEELRKATVTYRSL